MIKCELDEGPELSLSVAEALELIEGLTRITAQAVKEGSAVVTYPALDDRGIVKHPVEVTLRVLR